jgi:hypothetical protein
VLSLSEPKVLKVPLAILALKVPKVLKVLLVLKAQPVILLQ